MPDGCQLERTEISVAELRVRFVPRDKDAHAIDATRIRRSGTWDQVIRFSVLAGAARRPSPSHHLIPISLAMMVR